MARVLSQEAVMRLWRISVLFLGFLPGVVQAQEVVPQWLSNELYCVARVIYGEARNQSERAQYDVAFSVMNRKALNRRDFGGDSACGVAFYPGQYHGVTGKLNDYWQPDEWDVWHLSLTRAWRVYTSREKPHGDMREALYYLNPTYSSPAGKEWFKKLRPLKWSGAHRFYAER